MTLIYVRGHLRMTEASTTVDKLFRQNNYLRTACNDLQNSVIAGGSAEPFLTRVRNGRARMESTLQQVREEDPNFGSNKGFEDARGHATRLLSELNLS
ncbi:hypothetical protein [Streptomyces fagopyri]|uniref:hypothetical protein n=1 Tax=Streptomyces fagopyri TaxID=2662397 RepID=UPI0033F7732B